MKRFPKLEGGKREEVSVVFRRGDLALTPGGGSQRISNDS